MSFPQARFRVGERVSHRKFGYRGVIVDVDPTFDGTEEWYEKVARSRPPRDRPWYHILVHDAEHMTYVAERHLEPDESIDPIRHPLLEEFLEIAEGHRYRTSVSIN